MYRDSLKDYRRIVFILGEGKIINEVIFDGKSASINCEVFEKSTIFSFPIEELKNVMKTLVEVKMSQNSKTDSTSNLNDL